MYDGILHQRLQHHRRDSRIPGEFLNRHVDGDLARHDDAVQIEVTLNETDSISQRYFLSSRIEREPQEFAQVTQCAISERRVAISDDEDGLQRIEVKVRVQLSHGRRESSACEQALTSAVAIEVPAGLPGPRNGYIRRHRVDSRYGARRNRSWE